MDFFNRLFKSNSKPKSYDKYGDVLKKVMTTKDQRAEAIEILERLPAEDAIPQLLKRFEMVVDSGLLDNREKENCMKIIVSHGEKAKSFIEQALSSQKRLAWPIKIAEKIFEKEYYRDLLLKNLNTDMEIFDEDALARNEEILLALRELQDEKIVVLVKPFLLSRDENVRMAALECMETQAQQIPQAKDTILELSKVPLTDDNSRFLGVVHDIISKHHWL